MSVNVVCNPFFANEISIPDCIRIRLQDYKTHHLNEVVGPEHGYTEIYARNVFIVSCDFLCTIVQVWSNQKDPSNSMEHLVLM